MDQKSYALCYLAIAQFNQIMQKLVQYSMLQATGASGGNYVRE
jgi:hypothetical protein